MATPTKKPPRKSQNLAGPTAVAALAFTSTPAVRRRTRRTALVGLPETVSIKQTPDPDVLGRLRNLIDAFGHNQAAALLAVDRSQLSRCLKGTEKVSGELARRIVDLDYVLTRMVQIMHADEIGAWLLAPEPLLAGAIPLNVLRLSGPARVIAALDGIRAGSFA